MTTYVSTETGGPEVLQLQDRTVPVAQDDEVRSRVRAFGINRLEVDTHPIKRRSS